MKKEIIKIDTTSLQKFEILATLELIKKRLLKTFQRHIGEKNAIGQRELFIKVYEILPETLDTFRRKYWWDILAEMMKRLRSENTAFIINKNHTFFVLETKEECNYYKGIITRDITNLRSAMKRAEEWVEKKKWIEFAQLKIKQPLLEEKR